MHLKYAKMLVLVVHENMELRDNTLNNERLSLVNTKFLKKYSREVWRAWINHLLMMVN